MRSSRSDLIAGIALPLSAIPTFWAMSMLGFSLNLVTLLGITLVTGVLVDDAIVEIRSDRRNRFAALGDPDVLGDVDAGIFAQSGYLARNYPRDRRTGRRCDRRDQI